MFICDQTEPEPAVAAALAPLRPGRGARRPGWSSRHGDGLRAGVDLEPYGDDWWVLADVPASARPGRPLHAEHVLGIGGATQTLIGATVRRPVGTALDLGTGSGVQALHLATHAGAVTATDLSERALRFAATTAALNGQDWELLRGDLVAPVAGRRFDLVVSNPPFVVGPGHHHARLPRLRPGRRRDRRRTGRRRAGPAHRGRHHAVPGELGARRRRGLGASGWPAGSPAPAWTPG